MHSVFATVHPTDADDGSLETKPDENANTKNLCTDHSTLRTAEAACSNMLKGILLCEKIPSGGFLHHCFFWLPNVLPHLAFGNSKERLVMIDAFLELRMQCNNTCHQKTPDH